MTFFAFIGISTHNLKSKYDNFKFLNDLVLPIIYVNKISEIFNLYKKLPKSKNFISY